MDGRKNDEVKPLQSWRIIDTWRPLASGPRVVWDDLTLAEAHEIASEEERYKILPPEK